MSKYYNIFDVNHNKKAVQRLVKSWGLLFPAFALWILCSCTDDTLKEPANNGETWGKDPDAVALSFRMNLNKLSPTRAVAIDEIDNYVDTDNLQVLIFDERGDFLFESVDRIVTPTPDNNGQWNINIPIKNTMTDRNDHTFSLGVVKTQLEKGDFKIAVLANWTVIDNSGPYKVNWGWNESKLNPSVTTPKNINDLHHLERDAFYATDNRRTDAYNFIMKSEGLMGHKTEWVTSKLGKSKRGETESWIRTKWNPISGSDEVGHHDLYKTTNSAGNLDLWQVWNFGGYYKSGDITTDCFNTNTGVTYSDIEAESFESEWQQRNAKDFYTLFGEIEDGAPITYNSSGSSTDDNIKGDGKFFSVDGLTYVALAPTAKDSEAQNRKDALAFHQNGRHGIVLPKTNEMVKADDQDHHWYIKTSSQFAHGYFSFMAPGTGILKIKWSSKDPNGESRIIIQRNSNFEHQKEKATGSGLKDYSHEISITQDPQEIVIFNEGPNDAVIYSIEYICDKYLLDTDRQGILPNEETHPIPMYGVQNFSKIDNWGEQKILDLSENGKYVNLVRALAKVEVYFPSDNKPKYIFMRSMNKSARSEPMDVSTPTFDSWTKFTGTSMHDESHCEWFDIQKYGSGYSSTFESGVQNTTTVEEYQDWLSYFYGSWVYKWDYTGKNNIPRGVNDWIWDWNGKDITVPTQTVYPRIFNPSIDRSDFCEFIDMEDDDASGMNRYVLYVPDRNIDDPNYANELSSTPKVPHIEYRYPRHSRYLDDNDCLRIYFTDYETNSQIKDVYKDQFDNYEKNLKFLSYNSDGDAVTDFEEHLNSHWPIMRNHIYRFYIGSSNVTQEIRVSVTEFGEDEHPKKEVW